MLLLKKNRLVGLLILLVLCLILVVVFVWNKKKEIREDLTIMNDQDKIDANKYAMRAICEKKGHIWVDGENKDYDCLYTKETCLKTSKYPLMEDDSPDAYLEWRDNPGKCIGGNTAFRSFCEEEGLKYDPSTGECKTHKTYCLKRLLPFCNGDCYNPPVQGFFEKVFGPTITRSIGFILPESSIIQSVCSAQN